MIFLVFNWIYLGGGFEDGESREDLNQFIKNQLKVCESVVRFGVSFSGQCDERKVRQMRKFIYNLYKEHKAQFDALSILEQRDSPELAAQIEALGLRLKFLGLTLRKCDHKDGELL